MSRFCLFFISLTICLTLVACIPDNAQVTQPDIEDPIVAQPETVSQDQQSDSPCKKTGEKTCTILYVLSNLYDDEHVLKTRSRFEEAGYEVKVASDTLNVIRGFHECYDNTPADPNLLLEDVNVADYDAILFAGSQAFVVEFRYTSAAHRIASEAMEQGKVIAAAGNGPVILAQAGVLDGRTVAVLHDTPWDAITDEWIKVVEEHGATYSELSPVQDGLLITTDYASARFAWDIIEAIENQ